MLVSVLISAFGPRLGVVFARLLPYFLGILGVILIIWLIYDRGYDSGVANTEARYQTAILKERHRQIEANTLALEEARLRQIELRELLDEREDTIEELLFEGSLDPNADNHAIGVGSVRRINRIR